MRIKFKTRFVGLDRLTKSLSKLDKMEIAGGILESRRKHPEADISYATLLALHELSDGSKYPQRPVLKIAMRNNALKWTMSISNNLRKMFNRRGTSKVITYPEIVSTLKPVATMMQKDIQRTFYDSELKRNAKSTVKRKGFNRPMQETGKLRDHIKARVRKKKNVN